MNTNTITLFTVKNCPRCKMLKNRLDKQNKEYVLIDLSETTDDIVAMKDELKGNGYNTAPIVRIIFEDKTISFMDFKQAMDFFRI